MVSLEVVTEAWFVRLMPATVNTFECLILMGYLPGLKVIAKNHRVCLAIVFKLFSSD